MPDVNMPKLSDTMEEGTVVVWKKQSGDEVHSGDVLAEVESDKATFDLEAEADGVLQILVDQGVPAKIGAPIARIGDAGAQPAEPKAPADQGGAAQPRQKEPEAPAQVAEEREAAQASAAPKQAPAEKSTPATQRPAPAPEDTGGRQNGGAALKASPIARRL